MTPTMTRNEQTDLATKLANDVLGIMTESGVDIATVGGIVLVIQGLQALHRAGVADTVVRSWLAEVLSAYPFDEWRKDDLTHSTS